MTVFVEHTNADARASAIWPATRDATTDAKIAWLSTHQSDDQRDMWGATTGATGDENGLGFKNDRRRTGMF